MHIEATDMLFSDSEKGILAQVCVCPGRGEDVGLRKAESNRGAGDPRGLPRSLQHDFPKPI